MKKTGPIPTHAEFIGACDAAFAFLIIEHGFERAKEPREYNEFSVRYRKGELGVDVYGEGWGKYASCDLIRGKDELSLGLLFPREQRKALPAGQIAQVHELAARLKELGTDFLTGDFARFDAAVAEWKRVTAHRPVSEATLLERAIATAVTLAGHAAKSGNYAEVIRLLEPHESALSVHQLRMLREAREKLRS